MKGRVLNVVNIIMSIGLLVFLGNAVSHASSTLQQMEMKTMPKNLKNRTVAVWYSVTEINSEINSLANQAETDKTEKKAYLLSVPLLTSSLLANQDQFKSLLNIMQLALNELPANKNSQKAWLYGRMLMSADNINYASAVASARKEMKKILKDKTTPKDEFSTWAWAYLANLSNTEYNHAKANMKNSADQLTKVFAQGSNDTKRANALWAWVMCALAAANADDKEMYEYSLLKLKEITHEKTVSAALSKGLQRTQTTNDYPAWAIANIFLAAATYGDHAVFAELKDSLQNSINTAKQAHATEEVVLAELIAELATVREPQLAEETTN